MALQRLCALSDVKEPGSLRVELDSPSGPEAIAVVRFEGEVFALEDRCSHQDVPLTDGDVEEIDGVPTIECFLHGSDRKSVV